MFLLLLSEHVALIFEVMCHHPLITIGGLFLINIIYSGVLKL